MALVSLFSSSLYHQFRLIPESDPNLWKYCISYTSDPGF